MDGASVSEQLIGAARSNNEALIESLLVNKTPNDVAGIINTTTDPVGNTLLHVASKSGSLEVLDLLLDQEGVEIDPRTKIDRNTPLHLAVEYARGHEDLGRSVVELLIECGADPSPRNASGKRPIDLASGVESVVQLLRGAQYAADMQRDAAAVDGGDVCDEGEPTDEE